MICILSRYSLKPPNNSMIEGYVEKVVNGILKDEIDKDTIMEKFIQKFKNISKDMGNDKRWKAACCIVGGKKWFVLSWRVTENHQNY